MTELAVVQQTAAVVPAEPASGALMKIIDRAVSDPNFDVDKLQKLLDVRDRWEAQEAKKAFVEALNAFKANPPEIIKNKLVGFDTSKGRTEYRHATLDEVSLKIGQALSVHGLSHRWDVKQETGTITVTCYLQHRMGHTESVTMSGSPDTSGTKNSIQASASTVTYLERYTLLAITGMAVRDGLDNDGAGGAQGLAIDEIEAFRTAIEAAPDADALAKLWQQIVAKCNEAKDKATYDELKPLVTARGAALKAKKK